MLEYFPMICQDFLSHHCSSCELLKFDYDQSLIVKENQLKKFFNDEIDKIEKSVICTKGTEGSRNKAKLAVALVNSEIQFGFYDQNKLFKKLESCPLVAKPITQILLQIKNLLNEYKIVPYDLNSQKGELKYLLITYSESSGELLIRFVLRSKESFDRIRLLSSQLLNSVVTVNIQPAHQAILEGSEEIVVTSLEYITHSFKNVILLQGPRSFFQTNTLMAQELYLDFQHKLKKLNPLNVLDLYCGVGAFSYFAAPVSKKVLGIEISNEAIRFADLAKNKNNCNNIEFKAQDAEEFLRSNQEFFHTVIVNPPRRGLNDNILKMLINISPDYIFYSSCNAETLVRDYQILKSDYVISSIKLFDMFPYTRHFETLMILEKRK